MVSRATIGNTFTSWNPVTGCNKISAGCDHCYAERMARRLYGMGNRKYANGFKVTLHPHVLDQPLKWKKPQHIFVNSMSDLFHREVPVEFIRQMFAVMKKASHHQFQILTKRSQRLAKLSPRLDWPENVWMGVTVEDDRYKFRIDHLKQTGAKIKYLTLEPLLGPLPGLDLNGIDWVIVGGESGPGARPIFPEWVTNIRDQCVEARVPFFFKQWGGLNKKKSGRLLEGRLWEEMPVVENDLFTV